MIEINHSIELNTILVDRHIMDLAARTDGL
jgi:hypothetical protein